MHWMFLPAGLLETTGVGEEFIHTTYYTYEVVDVSHYKLPTMGAFY